MPSSGQAPFRWPAHRSCAGGVAFRLERGAVPPTPLWRMAIAGGALVYAFLGVDAPEITTDADALWPSMRSPLAPPSWFGG